MGKINRWSGETEMYGEITVHYTYKGYLDPGCNYGKTEKCYPPEGEWEIEIVGIDIYMSQMGFDMSLDAKQLEKAFPLVFRQLEEKVRAYSSENDCD